MQRALLLLLAGLVMGAPTGLQAQTRRALVIGINRYEAATPAASFTGGSSRGRITDLSGAVNDATAFRDLLQARFGFDAGHMTSLIDQQATRDGIIRSIERLAGESQRGDVVVFYYAGHGSQRLNSLSPEPSKLDQTLVPADANAGVFDIRDKELARLFTPFVDKGVELVLIFDSCHSGSVARGGVGSGARERWAAVDMRDAADAGIAQAPEDRPNGALVISAAQDYQLATELDDSDGITHGIFTSALIATLTTVPPTEPVADVFKRVKARMQMNGHPQEPVIAGPADRLQRPIFGGGATAGKLAAAVVYVQPGGVVDLQGGPALGIREGAVLRKIGSTAADSAVMLTIDTVVSVSRVRGTLAAEAHDKVSVGDLFELVRWVASPNGGIAVGLPAAGPDAAAIRAIAADISTLRGSEGIRWIDDPTAAPADTTPMYVMQWSSAGWELRPQAGAAVALPRTPTAAQVKAALSRAAGGKDVRFFLSLPPTRALAATAQGSVDSNSTIRFTTELDESNYILVGRAAGDGVEYALVQPDGSPATADGSSLPLRTPWVASTGTAASDSSVTRALMDNAFTLARVRSWLTLEGPPSDGVFPYRLAFKRMSDGAIRTDGPFLNGESWEVVLVADSAQITPYIERRRVYIFAIDNKGTGQLVYPSANVENRVPFAIGDDGRYPTEIPLGPRSRFTTQAPFGVDTFIMLSSDEPIDPWAFRWEGMRDANRSAGVRGSGLTALLGAANSGTRSIGQAAPLNWSIQRVPIRSQANP